MGEIEIGDALVALFWNFLAWQLFYYRTDAYTNTLQRNTDHLYLFLLRMELVQGRNLIKEAYWLSSSGRVTFASTWKNFEIRTTVLRN